MARAMSGAKLIAPTLLPYELASICLKKIERHPTLAKELTAAMQMAERLAIETVSVNLAEVVALARETGLTTYDSCYLWLAGTAGGATLITLDQQLSGKWRKTI